MTFTMILNDDEGPRDWDSLGLMARWRPKEKTESATSELAVGFLSWVVVLDWWRISEPVVVEENMSNLTSASGEASVSSGNRAETAPMYPQQQYFAPPNQAQAQVQAQPSVKKKRNLPGNPDPDAEVIALSPKTLMATNRFVCEICNKGFQRDQNLQLHRRGHNLPWKLKQRTSKEVRKKVKHGEKKWKCDKCSKRYAVQSDWKAHSKTCGTREYRCDCGTLFSRRDSFITHRAFCDALAEESARAITGNPVLLSSQAAAGPSSSTPHSHSQMSLQQQQQFNSNHDFHAFQMKKEQQSFSIRSEVVPPWLSSSSSLFPTRLDHDFTQTTQDLALHDIQNPNPNPSLGPTLPPYHPTLSPHMSATALLQKAAQMGATMSKTTGGSGASPPAMIRPHQAHVSADHSCNNTTGFGLNLSSREEMGGGFVQGLAPFGNKAAAVPSAAAAAAAATGPGGGAPSPSLLLQDMMTSLSSATGFDSSSFEDAFGGMLNSRKNGNNLHQTLPSKSTTTTATTHHSSGGAGNDGLTRDFLGLRALSHSDILSIAGLGTCMNTSPHDHQNQTQKPWQG
ncbi:Protein indeterminate-domain 11 [Vitis vinifera]|uniref:Protein indeterminate-domain 11 n=1 Tax=Vitis vinifera TaxID=29760 RepID=A0A438EWE7_VITVI|nr:Protein indeterminate-domain 11 [Vitis vinifera]